MKDISKAYTDKVLLDHVDFGIDTGARIGIIGINGTGKSTLLRLIAGKEEPGSGNIVMGNHVVIGYLPQNPDFSQDMTLYEYVVTENVRKIHPKDAVAAKELEYELEGEAKKILNLLGFTDIQEKISHLSGGQRKKAALCSVLLSRSDILLMDEPTNHLDITHQIMLMELVKKLNVTVISAIHDLNIAAAYCDKIYVLKDGVLEGYGTPEEVLTPELIRRIYKVEAEIVYDSRGKMHILFL